MMKTIKANMRSNTGSYASAGMLLLLMFLFWGASGQVDGTTYLSFNVNIPQITLIDIEPQGNNNISFSVVPPSEAGNRFPESGVTNNSLWINYTNSRLVNGPSRSVIVQVLGDIPDGVILQLQASPRSATCGRGAFGTPAGLVTLSNSPQALISGIGGSFTGDGPGCGHQLTFTFKVTNYESLQYIQNRSLQLTYTLADN
jgi:hypothetical protein